MSRASSRPVRSAAGVLIVVGAVAGCNDGLPTGSTSVVECAAGAGRTHTGQLSGSQVWTKQNGPHRLVDSVTTSGMITIDAGALVCGTPGSVLAPAVLRVEGTADSPVVLTATDSLVGWGGIRGAAGDESSVIRHASIRHALWGVRQTSSFGVDIVIENTTIFRSRGAALVGAITARDVLIDSACVAASTCHAVVAWGYRLTTLVNPVIRNSRGGGIFVPERSGVNLTGGTISGSRGIGITTQHSVRGSGSLSLQAPVRITGGDTIPVSLAGVPAVLQEREGQLGLLGNAIDQIHVHGMISGEHEVYRELPWRINASCDYGFGIIGTLRLEPGAAVTIEAGCDVAGEILGEGTAADPILISSSGVRLRAWDVLDRTMPDTVRLTHARISNMRVMIESVPAVLEDVELDQSPLTFGAAGSRLTRAHIHDSAEDGVLISADDVVITDCTIESNARHGVHVESGQPRITRCNLQDNGGAGVSNIGAGTVDASDNWWGDAAGPNGPDGDGIAGAVLYDPFRTMQVIW